MAQTPIRRPTISTHVLDTELGVPAVGVHVRSTDLDDGRAIRMTQALTDIDGRVRDLLERPLAAGDYRLEFSLGKGDVLRATQPRSRHLSASRNNADDHVPLLKSGFALSTYRGS